MSMYEYSLYPHMYCANAYLSMTNKFYKTYKSVIRNAKKDNKIFLSCFHCTMEEIGIFVR